MIQLGHLYEHIFCAHVCRYFHERQLFPYLDYSLIGKTYHEGIIVIDIELYSAKAREAAAAIPTLTLTFDKRSVEIAACQLMAELEGPPRGTTYDALVAALEDLERQPWLPLDELTTVDVKKVRRRAGPLYISEGAPVPTRRVTISLLLDPEVAASHRHLLPLFRAITGFVSLTCSDAVADAFGFFCSQDTFVSTPKATGMRAILLAPRVRECDIAPSKIIALCQETRTTLQDAGAFTRLVEDFRCISYSERYEFAPNLETIYEDTLILVGAKGWRDLANEENCTLLLAHTSLEVKVGRDKVTARLL